MGATPRLDSSDTIVRRLITSDTSRACVHKTVSERYLFSPHPMATLVRTQTAPAAVSSSESTRIGQQYRNDLQRSIPAPFPSAVQIEQEELLQELAMESVYLEQTSTNNALHDAASSQEMMQSGSPLVLGQVRSNDSLSVSSSLTLLRAVTY